MRWFRAGLTYTGALVLKASSPLRDSSKTLVGRPGGTLVVALAEQFNLPGTSSYRHPQHGPHIPSRYN